MGEKSRGRKTYCLRHQMIEHDARNRTITMIDECEFSADEIKLYENTDRSTYIIFQHIYL